MLRKRGPIDPAQERLSQEGHSAIEDHLQAFAESLADNTPKHVRLTMTRVRAIVDGSGFRRIADIDSEQVQSCLRQLKSAEGFGNRTYNHYVQAIDSFCNWCVETRRAASNPLLGLERLNCEVDVRHARRALPDTKELARHTDVKMTMKYAHVGIDDQAKGLAGLPVLHMRCSLDGVGCQPASAAGTKTSPRSDKTLAGARVLPLVVTACRTVAEWKRRESSPHSVGVSIAPRLAKNRTENGLFLGQARL